MIEMERMPRITEHVRDYSQDIVKNFSTQVFGKCILSGEHSVLRGVPALVVPVRSRSLELWYQASTQVPLQGLKIKSQDEQSEATKLVLWGILERALSGVGKGLKDLEAVIQVRNRVPFGAGLGASAALCVAVARLFNFLDWLPREETLEFARTLEDIFHGESSGVDVAVAEKNQPIKYVRGKEIEELHIMWKPELYLSFSGRKGVTSECVQRVQEFITRDPVLGQRLDNIMRVSVEKMELALTSTNMIEELRLKNFVEAMDLALNCYQSWGLTKGYLGEHIETVRGMGALALKPTGSGGGGHVLSLWGRPPPRMADIEFFRLEL